MKYRQILREYAPDDKWDYPYFYRYEVSENEISTESSDCYKAFLMSIYKTLRDKGINLLELCNVSEMDIRIAFKDDTTVALGFHFPTDYFELNKDIDILNEEDLKTVFEEYKTDSFKKIMSDVVSPLYRESRRPNDCSLDFTGRRYFGRPDFKPEHLKQFVKSVYSVMEWNAQMTDVLCSYLSGFRVSEECIMSIINGVLNETDGAE